MYISRYRQKKIIHHHFGVGIRLNPTHGCLSWWNSFNVAFFIFYRQHNKKNALNLAVWHTITANVQLNLTLKIFGILHIVPLFDAIIELLLEFASLTFKVTVWVHSIRGIYRANPFLWIILTSSNQLRHFSVGTLLDIEQFLTPLISLARFRQHMRDRKFSQKAVNISKLHVQKFIFKIKPL